MIEQEQLLLHQNRFMNDRQLEKNYLQTLLLFELSSAFSKNLIFKGGTALSMFYNLNRFSEDLDFTYLKEKDRATTVNIIQTAFKRINDLYQLGAIKRRGTNTSLDIEIHIKGPLYSKRKTEQSIEINLSMREEIILPPSTLTLSPIYSDIPTFLINVMDIKEILAEKVRALLTRKEIKARDVYDIYHLLKNRHVEANNTLINQKLLQYDVKFSHALLLKRLNLIDKNLWLSEMSNLVTAPQDYNICCSYIKKYL